MCTITIASDFSDEPAGRYVDDGPNSGELFRETLLLPALKKHQFVVVDIDDVFLLPSSFLHEAFAKLVEAGWSAKELKKRLKLQYSDPSDKYYEEEVWRYIEEARHAVT